MNQLKMYRCIKLMELLQETPRQIYTIARYLGVSDRTVYRYFDLFKQLGYTLERDSNNKYKLTKWNNTRYGLRIQSKRKVGSGGTAGWMQMASFMTTPIQMSIQIHCNNTWLGDIKWRRWPMSEEAKMALLMFSVGIIVLMIGMIYNERNNWIHPA